MKNIFLIFSIFLSTTILAQISSYSPLYPQVNTIMEIKYNPYIKNSRFSINSDVYLIIWETTQNGEHHSSYKKMEKEDSIFISKVLTKENSAFYTLHFITLSENSFDMSASLKIMIYDNNKKAVRNAHLGNMSFRNYEEEFNKELKYYPNNFAAYRTKWFNEKFQKPDSIKTIVKTDLKLIENSNFSNIEKLFALSYGHLILGDYSQSITTFKEMLKLFPHNSYTFSTIQSILYELRMNNITDNLFLKSKDLAENLLLENIYSSYSRDYLISNFNFISDSCLVKICDNWIESVPDDSQPYNYKATIYKKLSQNLSETEQLFAKSIELMLKGKLRLYFDISGKMTTMFLASTYQHLAEVSYQLKNYTKAFASIKASQSLNQANKKEAYEIEGNIWFALGNYKLAENAYLLSWNEGSQKAKDYLHKCYIKKYNSSENFEKYFQNAIKQSTETTLSENKKINNPKNLKRKKAIDFEVTTLSNKKISLSSLKGKIIVMNFWFTGCGPCKQEIPSLNELVQKYKKKDVVFLAFSLDDNLDLLNKFIAKYPFKYQIIPKSGSVAKKYNIKVFPSHIIINKNGNIISKFIGGGENIKDDLSSLINRLL